MRMLKKRACHVTVTDASGRLRLILVFRAAERANQESMSWVLGGGGGGGELWR